MLPQNQKLNLLYTRLNEGKCKKLRTKVLTDKDKLLECLALYDSYIYLDQLNTGSIMSHDKFQLYPAELTPSLSETSILEEDFDIICEHDRASFECQVLRTFDLKVHASSVRYNEFRIRDLKRHSDERDCHRSASRIISDFNCNYDHLSGIRTICKTEEVRAASNTKRRFLHYFHKELDEVTRDKLAEMCLTRDCL